MPDNDHKTVQKNGEILCPNCGNHSSRHAGHSDGVPNTQLAFTCDVCGYTWAESIPSGLETIIGIPCPQCHKKNLLDHSKEELAMHFFEFAMGVEVTIQDTVEKILKKKEAEN